MKRKKGERKKRKETERNMRRDYKTREIKAGEGRGKESGWKKKTEGDMRKCEMTQNWAR